MAQWDWFALWNGVCGRRVWLGMMCSAALLQWVRALWRSPCRRDAAGNGAARPAAVVSRAGGAALRLPEAQRCFRPGQTGLPARMLPCGRPGLRPACPGSRASGGSADNGDSRGAGSEPCAGAAQAAVPAARRALCFPARPQCPWPPGYFPARRTGWRRRKNLRLRAWLPRSIRRPFPAPSSHWGEPPRRLRLPCCAAPGRRRPFRWCCPRRPNRQLCSRRQGRSCRRARTPVLSCSARRGRDACIFFGQCVARRGI